MRATVAICTYNRAAYLGEAIRSVASQPVHGEFPEVLVIDNASTDDTPKVVADYPVVRYIHEPTLGLSVARNRALREASGDVVAFLDDDAVACDRWLERHYNAFEDKTVGATGGRIDLVWPLGRHPRWLSTAFDGHFAGLDLGAAEDIAPGDGPYGANMAVRRELALELGGFNPHLGRTGTNLISNEETDFFARVRATHVVRYVPTAVVDHHVIQGRDTLKYVLERSYAAGQSDAIARAINSAPPLPITATLRSLAKNVARVVTMRGAGDRGIKGAVAGAAWAAEDLGRLSGRRGASALRESS